MNPNSLWDVYFGEFVCPGRDGIAAPGIKSKLLYIVMPPEWSHTGSHKTAQMVRDTFIAEENVAKDIDAIETARVIA